MRSVDLEKPFTLNRDFWIAYSLLILPILWLVRPWSWELPLYSQIAGYAFLPFAAAIMCYCPVALVVSIARGSSKERRIGAAFLAGIAGSALFLGVIWWLRGFDDMPSLLGAGAAIIANLIFAGVVSKPPNHFPHPTPPSRRG
jgi:hypothetical protein